MTAACTVPTGIPSASRADARLVTVVVESELGGPAEGARLELVGQEAVPVDGSTEVQLDQPAAGVIRADGYLDEPVVLDPGDDTVTVRLLRRIGPTGVERRVLHFGGDVMMGRRYQGPASRPGTPHVASAEDARAVVSDIAPLMAAADSTMVNLETVVGELPPESAYSAKRYQLQSPPIIVDALQELGVDFAALGNNHAYDWQEAGVRSTTDALDAGGIAWAGAGATSAEAVAGRLVAVRGTEVGVVSATTVNGDFVNDSLPTADTAPPDDLVEADAWQYEARSFGFGAPGDAGFVAVADRRPGDAWRAFRQLEPELSVADGAELWAALTQDGAYPELQDWVARRGHGGAAPVASSEIARQISDLRARGADLAVVQIHGGYQFSDVPSDFMRRSARAAIDAGADLVVAHHPHVLQGFEWYQGKLIAYSLGNFVFDQDFLSTFPSAILRTVFEGSTLVEARVVPVTIEDYRPVPVSGEAATRVLRLMSARSGTPASSDRLQPELVASVLDDAVVPNAAVERDGATALVTHVVDGPVDTIELGQSGQVALQPCTLASRTADIVPDPDLELGTDLLGWGSLEDDTADRSSAPAPQWQTSGSVVERYSRERGAYLHLAPTARTMATARQVARSTVPEHRWYDAAGEAVDSPPSYTAQLEVRRDGAAPRLAITLYDVNDTDPTVEPMSIELHKETVTLPRTTEGEWKTVSVDLTELISRRYGGVRPEALLLSVVERAGSDQAGIDDVQLLEWRAFDELPVGAWVAVDALRGDPGSAIALSRRGCL